MFDVLGKKKTALKQLSLSGLEVISGVVMAAARALSEKLELEMLCLKWVTCKLSKEAINQGFGRGT